MNFYYLDGRLVRGDRNVIRPTTHAFNYGTAAIEGMRALWDAKQQTWHLFRSDRHFARLQQGATMLGIDWDMTYERFARAVCRLILKNDLRKDLYIRPIVYHAAEGVGLTRTGNYGFAVYVQVMPFRKAVCRSVCLVPQRRPTDGSCSVKIAGNYALSFMAQRSAREKGYSAGIMLSSDGYLSEAAVMNLFWTKDGTLFTPSLDCGPLPGITRDCVIRIARDVLGVKVHEGKYRPGALSSADEIFLCGTGTAIAPVNRFDDRPLSVQKDLLTARIWTHYRRILRSRPREYSDWFRSVT